MTKRTCSIAECSGAHYARTWCLPHYRRWQRNGDPLGGRQNPPNACSVEECPEPHAALGYCITHYRRVKRRGNPYTDPTDADPVVVERAIGGDWQGSMTPAERREVIRRLHRIRYTDRQIADHVDISIEGVATARRRMGLRSVGR